MINYDGLTGKRLVVATPMYGGQCSGFYMRGMMDLASLCAAYGVRMQTVILGDSLVTRARNRCVDAFKSLAGPDDPLMFIDSDILFNGRDVLSLMLMNLDVVGALYPLKQINWRRVRNVIKRQPDTPIEVLTRAATDYVFNIKLAPGQTNGKIDVSEKVAVRDIGTGFVMIRRRVFDKIEEAGMAKPYNPCMNEEIFSGEKVFEHFPCGIDTELLGEGDGNYISEDWAFCRRWQKLGGDVWAIPWIKLTHFGPMGFEGDLTALAASGAKIGEEYGEHPNA